MSFPIFHAAGRVLMDECRMAALFGVVVASTAARPGKVNASVALKMDWWRLVAAASECAPDRWVPHTRQVAWLGSQVLDVRFGCEVCLVLGPDYQHFFIVWIGVATLLLPRRWLQSYCYMTL